MTIELGERCENCVLALGQPWCEKLNRQLPSTNGLEPYTPADCPVKSTTDGNCNIVKEAPKEVFEQG
jgi:hypothetical protein